MPCSSSVDRERARQEKIHKFISYLLLPQPVTSYLSGLKQHTFLISGCGPGICFDISHKAGSQCHPEPRCYLKAAGEGSVSKFTWLLAEFQFLKGCYIEGLSSQLTVGLRPPSVHCLVGAPNTAACFLEASKGESLLRSKTNYYVS